MCHILFRTFSWRFGRRELEYRTGSETGQILVQRLGALDQSTGSLFLSHDGEVPQCVDASAKKRIAEYRFPLDDRH